MDQVRSKALELGVYLPLGAYARVRDELTDITRSDIRKAYTRLVDRGQDRIQPLERRIRRQADDAERQVKATVTKGTRTAKTTARKAGAKATAASSAVAPKLPRVAAPKKASDLPIKGYNSLTASEIVAETRGLTQTDLARVYKFEKANENRSTILDALESRFVQLPIPTYDTLNVDEISARIDGLTADELRTLRRYESDTKARATVIDKIDAALS
jgi:hypothetical protein